MPRPLKDSFKCPFQYFKTWGKPIFDVKYENCVGDFIEVVWIQTSPTNR